MISTHYSSKVKATKSALFVSDIVKGLYSKLDELHAKPKFRQLFWQLGEDAFCNLLTQSIVTQHDAKRFRIFSELKVDTIDSKGFVDLCVIDDAERVAYIIEAKYFYEQASNPIGKWNDIDSKQFYQKTLHQAGRYIQKPSALWQGMEVKLIALGFSATEFNNVSVEVTRAWNHEPSFQNEFYGFQSYDVTAEKMVGLAVYGKVESVNIERMPSGLKLIA